MDTSPSLVIQPRIMPADYRSSCGRLLFRGLLAYGTEIQIRCPKCGRMHVIKAISTSVIAEAVLPVMASLPVMVGD